MMIYKEKIKNIFRKISQNAAVAGAVSYILDNKWLWAVLAYCVLLHYAECLCFYFGSIKKSVGNPFIQGLWSWLALFGIGMLAGGRAAKIILTFLVILQTLVFSISAFLSLTFSLTLRADAFAVLAVSSVQEITEFCSVFLNMKGLLGVLAGILVLTLVLTALWKNPVKRKIYLYVISAILILPQLINAIRFSVNEEYEDIYCRNSIAKLVSEFLEYRENIQYLFGMMNHPQLPAGVRCAANDEDLTAVLVLGESATRFHHSIYGYPRNTSPLLNEIRDKLLIFTDVISGFAHTVQSCLYMFTTEDKLHPRDYRYTMFDIFKAAGFKVYFFSNQFRWGEYDSPIGMISAHADKRAFAQEEKPNSFDDSLLKMLETALRKKGKKLIVLHLIGSHANYKQRSPASFKVFTDKNRLSPPCEVDDWDQVDEYDNSILFTDHVLRQTADQLKGYKGAAFMLYCSDHGDFPEQIVRQPRSADSKSIEPYEIPFILYANPVYREKYTDFLNGVRKNVDKPYMTDQLMYSMFSASRITFDGFPYEKDLFSPEFIPPSERQIGRSSNFYHSRGNPYLLKNSSPSKK